MNIILTFFLSFTITLIIRLLFNTLSNFTVFLLFCNIFLLNIINLLYKNTKKIKKKKKIFKINIKRCTPKISPIMKEWTSDKIIPLKKYNRNDCTNDSSCVISPDKNNLFPNKNYSASQNMVKPTIKLTGEILYSMNHCKLCNSILDLNNNKVTENFTTFNPYRPNDSYSNPDKIKRKQKIEDILNTIMSNIKNNKSHTNINIEDIKKVSKDLCLHCKTGLCLNDTCYSI